MSKRVSGKEALDLCLVDAKAPTDMILSSYHVVMKEVNDKSLSDGIARVKGKMCNLARAARNNVLLAVPALCYKQLSEVHNADCLSSFSENGIATEFEMS
ncbi:hypothetical protein ACH5RR_006494 [Cinchona calisaya]|uniref:Uncharacterized protein n=1 Tax=Cinchona calisaya TaxID=153742 RepID=A0ABD3AP53_9GENT